MKKIKYYLLGFFCILTAGFCMTACEEEHIHNYTPTGIAPTCLEQGYTTYTCACGEAYQDDYVDALGHDELRQTVQEPTCTQVGWCTVSCSRCDYSAYDMILALGHTSTADDGDCTTDILCTTCHTVLTEGNAEHTFDNDCTTADKCANCDQIAQATEMFEVSINGHKGYTIIGDGVMYDGTSDCWTATVPDGSVFTFFLDIGAFYTGIPNVIANNITLLDSNGTYSVTIEQETNIFIDGIVKEVSNMIGTGAFDNAYVVSRPIDLVYIAEQVNAGRGNYAQASYVLAADIDLKGETLTPIGTETNPFSGCFACLTDGETGAMERFVISNFKINATDKNYVGLFGCVQIDMSVLSSALFYGIRIADFTINTASSNLQKSNRNIYCGGLIGYGIGTRTYLCDATNGTINICADSSEFSFAGGLIGVQQSMYVDEYNLCCNAEVAYANVDVDINVVSGTALYAGGITGYLCTNSFVSPAYIYNSYATGNVNGAIRSGGIAGGLGQYTSITTCYSTGNVSAKSNLTSQTDGYMKEYCLAYAGGIVGYAENDSIVNDCFALGNLTAIAADGESAQHTHFAVGGGDEDGAISLDSRKYVIRNCLGELEKSTMQDTLSKMGWQSYNWVLSNTAYPTINYEMSEEIVVTVTIKFVDKTGNAVTVDGEESVQYTIIDTYVPIASAFVDGIIEFNYTSDDKNLVSVGYFFDEACTIPVPYSFITTRTSEELYVGFVDAVTETGK